MYSGSPHRGCGTVRLNICIILVAFLQVNNSIFNRHFQDNYPVFGHNMADSLCFLSREIYPDGVAKEY